jgi:acetyltransferase-like isoleucine patch superfamily enzyme
MKASITGFVTLIIPINFIKVFFLKLLGHEISYSSRIGMSFIKTKRIILSANSSIGRFNYIKIEQLQLEKNSFIKHANFIRGPFQILIKEKGSITSQNKIRRAYAPITSGISKLEIGFDSHIVSNQFLDLTKSIIIGSRSQVAGIGAQFWTHGYYHFKNLERIRIDGDITIGDNVYIGSRCTFNAGVKVADNITIGSNSTISKDLTEEGLYVNQALRFVEKEEKSTLKKLKKIDDQGLFENVYEKK